MLLHRQCATPSVRHPQSRATASGSVLAGGSPWPLGLRRANLGPGYYAWASLEEAERYRDLLQRHGITGLLIVAYAITDEDLKTLKQLDLTRRSDEEVNAWMEKHSHYGDAEPHDWEYVIRGTDIGIEHYFAAGVFDRLKEVP